MALVRLQGEKEKQQGVYIEYDSLDPPLGKGGMGKVYKGWWCSENSSYRREVAIKFLYKDLPQHVVTRGRREAAVQIRNDNVIEMLGFVEINTLDELGQPCVRYHVVSEYLHGITLDKLLEGNIRDNEGNIIPYVEQLYDMRLTNPYNFAVTVIRSVLSGLMALHDAGYIHRDIDPSNIMVTADGKIKLIDFGIAKKIDGSITKESSFTIDGQFIGKPRYAAPELVRGLVDSQNFTTDLYAVGILLFQLLTGKVPFDGEMAEVLEMQLNKNLPLQEVKQRQIREVIKKATSKKRENRFQSAAEFRVALDRIAGLPYPAKGVPWMSIAYGAGALIVTTALIVGASSLMRKCSSSPALAPATADSVYIPVEEGGSFNAADEYGKAVKLMEEKQTAPEGLAIIEALSNSGDYQATFLLSRLYFSSGESVHVGAFSDSVALFRKNLNMPVENRKAHSLLKRAVDINPHDYRSLFELGCDYKSRNRGAVFNTDSAYIYLDKARTLAVKAGDKEYQRYISKRIENLSPAR